MQPQIRRETPTNLTCTMASATSSSASNQPSRQTKNLYTSIVRLGKYTRIYHRGHPSTVHKVCANKLNPSISWYPQLPNPKHIKPLSTALESVATYAVDVFYQTAIFYYFSFLRSALLCSTPLDIKISKLWTMTNIILPTGRKGIRLLLGD